MIFLYFILRQCSCSHPWLTTLRPCYETIAGSRKVHLLAIPLFLPYIPHCLVNERTLWIQPMPFHWKKKHFYLSINHFFLSYCFPFLCSFSSCRYIYQIALNRSVQPASFFFQTRKFLSKHWMLQTSFFTSAFLSFVGIYIYVTHFLGLGITLDGPMGVYFLLYFPVHIVLNLCVPKVLLTQHVSGFL